MYESLRKKNGALGDRIRREGRGSGRRKGSGSGSAREREKAANMARVPMAHKNQRMVPVGLASRISRYCGEERGSSQEGNRPRASTFLWATWEGSNIGRSRA